MSHGVLLLVTGAGIARFGRKKRWWLRAHKALALTGSSLVLIGAAAAFLMVAQSGGAHVKVPHAGIGLAVVFLAVITPVFGLMQFKVKEKAAQFRTRHRWSGRITPLTGLVTILSGLRTAGII